jgi:membrane-associated HD superfamily phosphohydrolase
MIWLIAVIYFILFPLSLLTFFETHLRVEVSVNGALLLQLFIITIFFLFVLKCKHDKSVNYKSIIYGAESCRWKRFFRNTFDVGFFFFVLTVRRWLSFEKKKKKKKKKIGKRQDSDNFLQVVFMSSMSPSSTTSCGGSWHITFICTRKSML